MPFLYRSRHSCRLPKAKGKKAHRMAGSVWLCPRCGQYYRGHIWRTAAQDKLSWHRITKTHAEKVLNELEARRKRLPKL